MKYIIIILLVLTSSCNAQNYSLNTPNKSDAPAGSYFQDLNGDLDKYVGLWLGNWNGKAVFLELRKIKESFTLGNNLYYKDKILGERKIINSNGIIEIDRITNFDNTSAEFSGISINPANLSQKRLLFFPKNMCGIWSNLNITNITATTMTLQMVATGGRKTPNCVHDAYVQQNGAYPLNFPKDIVLTKQ